MQVRNFIRNHVGRSLAAVAFIATVGGFVVGLVPDSRNWLAQQAFLAWLLALLGVVVGFGLFASYDRAAMRLQEIEKQLLEVERERTALLEGRAPSAGDLQALARLIPASDLKGSLKGLLDPHWNPTLIPVTLLETLETLRQQWQLSGSGFADDELDVARRTLTTACADLLYTVQNSGMSASAHDQGHIEFGGLQDRQNLLWDSLNRHRRSLLDAQQALEHLAVKYAVLPGQQVNPPPVAVER